MVEYQQKTDPFEHQDELFEKTKEFEAFAILWEQGCGKTKPTIDTGAWLYLNDEIDAFLVVAPNGVHRNWVTDEIPTHLPDNVAATTMCHFYQSPKANTKWHQRDCEALLKYKGLAILTMSYEGFMTERGKKFAWKFLRQRRCLYPLDESQKIKKPGAKRTKSIVASGKYAPYRRILTGTPVGTGPFDLYSQIKFLVPNFWFDRGIGSFAAFKQRYGVWLTRADAQNLHGYDPGYDQLLSYKNVEELEQYLKVIGHRLTKDEALDLPPKLYSKIYFDMTSQQSRAYNELVEEYITELDCGTMVEASLAIVRLLRLQQITCGYVVAEAEEPATLIGDKNPRLDATIAMLEDLPHPAIIWSRFRNDINLLMDALGDKAVRYDGAVKDDDRALAREMFQGGEKQFFVSNPQAGGTGLTLTAARTVVYYSNNFNLIDRLQSEDRAHRIGQEHPVEYIDVIAPKTIDEQIVKNLRGKFDIASKITGDKFREWL
ncbi:DEAD/DEAH box helicase [Candidatus Pacearchaeota archaeon]|nr:DEAD/DEAH box helicase [Candidatus Pacearchaeota archaeon]